MAPLAPRPPAAFSLRPPDRPMALRVSLLQSLIPWGKRSKGGAGDGEDAETDAIARPRPMLRSPPQRPPRGFERLIPQ